MTVLAHVVGVPVEELLVPLLTSSAMSLGLLVRGSSRAEASPQEHCQFVWGRLLDSVQRRQSTPADRDGLRLE
jgi:hypothetical protein